MLMLTQTQQLYVYLRLWSAYYLTLLMQVLGYPLPLARDLNNGGIVALLERHGAVTSPDLEGKVYTGIPFFIP